MSGAEPPPPVETATDVSSPQQGAPAMPRFQWPSANTIVLCVTLAVLAGIISLAVAVQ